MDAKNPSLEGPQVAAGAVTGRAFDPDWAGDKFNTWNGTTFRTDLVPFTVPATCPHQDLTPGGAYDRLRSVLQDEDFLCAVASDYREGDGDTQYQLGFLRDKFGIINLETALVHGTLVTSLWNSLHLVPKHDADPSQLLFKGRVVRRDYGGNYVVTEAENPDLYNVRALVSPAPMVPAEEQLYGEDYYRQLELCLWDAGMYTLETLPKDLFHEHLGVKLRDILVHPEVQAFLTSNKYQVVNRDCNLGYLRDLQDRPSSHFIGLFYVGETAMSAKGFRYPRPVPFT
jgi:hypothetical protein